MADLSLITDRYAALIRKLFPTGWAWEIEKDSTFDKLVKALAVEPARIEQRAYDFLREMDPNQTFELLEVWERLLGIPDECTPTTYDPSIYERRVRIIQKLTTGGGQSVAFFKLIAQQLGYDIDVFDVKNYRDFRVGISRVGDALTNSTDPDGSVNDAGWAFAFQIKAPAEFVRYFRVGQSTVGERLVLAQNETLECVIRRFAPAHTTPIFSYGD